MRIPWSPRRPGQARFPLPGREPMLCRGADSTRSGASWEYGGIRAVATAARDRLGLVHMRRRRALCRGLCATQRLRRWSLRGPCHRCPGARRSPLGEVLSACESPRAGRCQKPSPVPRAPARPERRCPGSGAPGGQWPPGSTVGTGNALAIFCDAGHRDSKRTGRLRRASAEASLGVSDGPGRVATALGLLITQRSRVGCLSGKRDKEGQHVRGGPIGVGGQPLGAPRQPS
jgi:hypothetical protein